jgi:hypothetical protein
MVFPDMVLETLGHRLLFAVGFPLALALLFGHRTTQGEVKLMVGEDSYSPHLLKGKGG